MIDQITKAFDGNKNRSGTTVRFTPEIKVNRAKDTLYISEIRQTKINFMAVVEVYDGKNNDKAPMPLGMLDDVSLKAIYIRLSA